MTNTALGAGAEKAQEIIFISEAHEKFYYEKLKEVRYQADLRTIVMNIIEYIT